MFTFDFRLKRSSSLLQVDKEAKRLGSMFEENGRF